MMLQLRHFARGYQAEEVTAIYVYVQYSLIAKSIALGIP